MGTPSSNLYLQPAPPRPLLRNQGTLFVPLNSDEYVGDAGLSNPGPSCNFGEGLPEGILGKEWGTVLPGIPGRVLTNQEVKDGHVDDAEKPVAAVVWVDLLYRVTVEGVELPPEGEKKSWGWKSQDARVLGPLSILPTHAHIPASPNVPWPTDLRMPGSSWLPPGGPRGRTSTKKGCRFQMTGRFRVRLC